jgi:predicted nucleic acid-binding protein
MGNTKSCIKALVANIISFILKKDEGIRKRLASNLASKTKIVIPRIAFYEVKRGLVAVNARHLLNDLSDLCCRCPVGHIDDTTIDEALKIYVELQHKGRPCDENDIYIAAFCRIHGLTLVTNNTKHFEHIDGLDMEDWSATEP